MRREADVDRQHPELGQHLQDAAFGRDRQSEDDEVELGVARVGDEIVHVAELGIAGDDVGGPVVVAVVEHADEADAAGGLRLDRAEHLVRRLAAANDGGPAVEPAGPRQARHEDRQDEALGEERAAAGEEEACEPDARKMGADLGEEQDHQRDQRHQRPRGHDLEAVKGEGAEGADRIGAERLQEHHRQRRHAADGEGVVEIEGDLVREIQAVDQDSGAADEQELAEPHRAGEHDRRVARPQRHLGDALRGRRAGGSWNRAPRRRRVGGGRGGRLQELPEIEPAHAALNSHGRGGAALCGRAGASRSL
jgi:hypothetical protein